MNPFETVNLILCETSSLCNQNCKYCYVSPSVRNDSKRRKSKMSVEVFQKNYSRIIGRTIKNDVSLIYHGGEPLLMGVDWLSTTSRYAISEAKKVNKNLKIGIQTNGSLINDILIDYFIDNNVSLGVSLDGPPEINDIQRANGEKIMNNIIHARQRGVNLGILLVVGEHNYNKMDSVIKYFIDKGFSDIKATYLNNIGNAEKLDEVDSDKFLQASIDILNAMILSGGQFTEQQIAWMVLFFFLPYLKTSFMGCHEYYCQGGAGFIAFDQEGDFYPCGPAAEEKKYKLMKYNDDEEEKDFSGISIHKRTRKDAKCQYCEAKTICIYPCPLVGLSTYGNVHNPKHCYRMNGLLAEFRRREDELIKIIPTIYNKYSYNKSNIVLGNMNMAEGEILDYTFSFLRNPLIEEVYKDNCCWLMKINGKYYSYRISTDEILSLDVETYCAAKNNPTVITEN